jgi:hydrogenase nickel incorporation protein HypA/HybF
MHELALAHDLLAAIELKLDGSAARVVRVNVSIGSAAGIVSESLSFAFRVLAEGTRANRAELTTTIVSARSRCRGCGVVFEFDGMIGKCPNCGELGGELLSGDEMILQAIQVIDV